MRCVQGMSVTTATKCVTSLSSFMCFVLILVFTLSLVSNVLPFSFTTHTQFQVQKFSSSGCCSPTLSCHRQLKLYPEFLRISHRENGSFEVVLTDYVGQMASSKSVRTPVLGDRANGYTISVSSRTESMNISTLDPTRCCRREGENTRYQGFKYLFVTGVAMVRWQWSHRNIRNSMGSGAQCVIVQRRGFFLHDHLRTVLRDMR